MEQLQHKTLVVNDHVGSPWYSVDWTIVLVTLITAVAGIIKARMMIRKRRK